MAESVKSKRLRKVYSTELINQLIKDKHEGYDVDMSPFFQRDETLRAANVPFRLTPEEEEEYLKCYENPEYFIEHYCKFQTEGNAGYQLVDLRDYQREVIRLVTAEKFDKEMQDVVPVNRNIVWLAARQVGKCVTFNNLIKLNKKDKEESVEIYKLCGKRSFLYSVKKLLYKLYAKLS